MRTNLSKKLTSVVVTLLVSATLFSGCSGKTTKDKTSNTKVTKTSVYKRAENVVAADAENLLKEGNSRFVENKALGDDISTEKIKGLATNGQKPFAVIFSCSDSRVPPENIFDQGLGDLFVIRNAGNVVDDITLGSIEYGVEHAAAPLIVVLGHENCGAIKATIDGGEASPNISAILSKIKPSFDKVKGSTTDKNELYENCADENVKNSLAVIKSSPVINKLEKEKKVTVIGAKYHIETGKVTFEE
ncbi:MAG: carbonic anhydrase [Clostridium sp.]|uniref:carbonic anhydrase n=1 Tax=Clostridium sp. TaxID=1506 RepID=UPI003D6CFEEA